MNKPGTNTDNLVVYGLQPGKELLDAEIAQGIDAESLALKSCQVQGHGWGGLVMECGQL